jgi:hypothetical protein
MGSERTFSRSNLRLSSPFPSSRGCLLLNYGAEPDTADQHDIGGGYMKASGTDPGFADLPWTQPISGRGSTIRFTDRA